MALKGTLKTKSKDEYRVLTMWTGIFIRSLYQAYTRIEHDSPEAALLRSYINVQVIGSIIHSMSYKLKQDHYQLNALLDLATTPGTNQYSPRWEGPPPSSLLPQGQLAATDVLYSALGLINLQDTASNASTG